MKLSLEEGQTALALATARIMASLKANPAILADAGRALLEARQYAVAREFLQKAAAANPSAGLELPLAIAAFHSSGANDGLKQMEAMPESARSADYYLALAQMLDAAGKNAGALAAIDRALSAAPDRSEIYWQKMVFLKNSGHVEDALDLLDRAGKSLPREPSIPVLRAALLESNGRTEQARELLQDTQRHWPEVPAVWVAEGLILAAHGNPEPARRALETAVSLGARSPEVTACLTALKQGSASDPERLFFTRPPQDW